MTELQEIKEGLDKIGTVIPSEMAGWVWNNYKKLANSNESQPCSTGCGGAGAHWTRAIVFLREWVKQQEANV